MCPIWHKIHVIVFKERHFLFFFYLSIVMSLVVMSRKVLSLTTDMVFERCKKFRSKNLTCITNVLSIFFWQIEVPNGIFPVAAFPTYIYVVVKWCALAAAIRRNASNSWRRSMRLDISKGLQSVRRRLVKKKATTYNVNLFFAS